MRLANKLTALNLIGVGAALAVSCISIVVVEHYSSVVDRLKRTSDLAFTAERAAGLIDKVVMESRGIYMSRDRAEEEKFTPTLLAEIDQLRLEITRWNSLLDPAEQSSIASASAHLADFIKLRTELVRTAREVGHEEARSMGDNDVNRANREALSRQIEGLAQSYLPIIAALTEDQKETRQYLLFVLCGMPAAAALLSLALTMIIARRQIVGPITRLSSAMTRLAAEDLAVGIEGTEVRDEIGEMAQAIQRFKETAIKSKALREDRAKIAEESAEQRKTVIRQLIDHLETTTGAGVKMMATASAKLQGSAQTLSSTAHDRSADASVVATSASEASSNVQTVAVAANDLSSSIEQTSQQVTEAAISSRSASAEASQTNATSYRQILVMAGPVRRRRLWAEGQPVWR